PHCIKRPRCHREKQHLATSVSSEGKSDIGKGAKPHDKDEQHKGTHRKTTGNLNPTQYTDECCDQRNQRKRKPEVGTERNKYTRDEILSRTPYSQECYDIVGDVCRIRFREAVEGSTP